MLNIKNDNKKLNYVGNFGTFSKEGEIIKYSQNKGDYVELNFIGNKVRFYTHTNAWSGTLTEGTSTITVSYNGKTTTFTVTVSASKEI